MRYKNLFVNTFFILIFLSSAITAQNKNEKEEPIKAIPVTEIVNRLENDFQVISKLSGGINGTETINVNTELAPLRKQIEIYKNEMDKIDIKTVTAGKLTDLEKRLSGFDTKMMAYQKEINTAIENINSGIISIDKIETVWNETYKSRSKQKIPKALLLRIDELLKSTRAAKKEIKNQLNDLIKLQNTISNEDLYVKDQLIIIRKTGGNIKKKLFKISNQPLWEITISSSLISQIKSTTIQKKESFIAYYKMYRINFVMHIFLFLFVLLLFTYIYLKKSDKSNTDEEINIATIFSYPISASLLTTCLLTPLFHSHGPSVVGQLNRLILFIPIIRLLPLLFLRNIKTITINMISLFILYSLSNLLISDFNMQRIIMTFLIILTLIGLLLLNRTKVISSHLIANDKWERIIRLAFYLAITLVLISFVAIVFGAVSFAKLIFGAILNSAYFAIIFLSGDKIFEGLGDTIYNAGLMKKSKFIQNNKDIILKRYKVLIHFLFITIWIGVTIALFGITDIVVNTITTIFTSSAHIGKISISLGSIVSFILAIYITFNVSKLIRAVLNDDVLPRISLPKGMPSTISTMTHYMILISGFLLAMSAAGMNWGNLAIIIGSLGVGIGFGLQNLVNNFVSGLILIFERPISIGDVVEVGTLMGNVKRIGIRSSTIRTFNESEVIVPNSLLISQEVVNWTLSDRQRRLDIPVGVAYGSDPKKVIAILQKVAEEHPKVKDYPKPFITFDGFGDSSLNFLLRIWAADFSEGLGIKTEVIIEIYKRFKEENIEIPFPQHDIHIIPPKQQSQKEDKQQKNEKEFSIENNINTGNEIVGNDDDD